LQLQWPHDDAEEQPLALPPDPPECPPSPPAPIQQPAVPPHPPTPPLALRCPQHNIRPPGNWWDLKKPVAEPLPPPAAEEEEDEAEEFAQYSSPSDPVNLTLALKRDDGQRWMQAAQLEMNGHMENRTWEIVDAPPGARILPCKWVLNKKYNNDRSLDRYKARIVAKGFNQCPGYDYTDVFAPTMRPASVHLVFALSATHDLYLHSIDVSMAFTNGDLNKTILMQQPEYFHDGNPNHVLHLLKSLYGLKQAARMWNKKLHAVLLELGFVRL
jgi:hypothetical protein